MLGKLPDSRWFAGKHLAHALPGGDLYRCDHCLLKFRYPVHRVEIYKELYDNAAIATWPADTARPDWDLISGHILEWLPQGGSVLDFGCYSGGLLARLGSAYERYGVEINRAAAAVASERIRGRVWPSIDDLPTNLRFDVVVVADVVEHVENPAELIHKLTALLSDHGILIVTTGDADNFLWNRFGANWWYCFYPEHIAFLSKSWLQYFSQRAGLVIVRCETFRYCKQSVIRRSVGFLFTCCYGWFPAAYLRLGGLLKEMLGRPGIKSVPGNGVSADHLFLVLTRGES
jgi:2-polyprenyl-3-methyl-5-hydroxy-6-metoxy-1,4-benzoquinol methylase